MQTASGFGNALRGPLVGNVLPGGRDVAQKRLSVPKLRPVRPACECSYLDFQGPLAARYGQGDRCGSFPAKTGVSVCSGPSGGEGEINFAHRGVITQTMTDQEKLNMLFDRAQIAEAIHRYPVSIDSRD